MAYQRQNSYSKSTTSASRRPSEGGQARAASTGEGASDFDTSTTHYAKNTNKEFVDVVQIWENEGKFGSYLKVRVTENLPAGDYFVTAKKGHSSKVTR